jgi:hypothetical protein
LVHFEQKDVRAWQALAYRIAPGIEFHGDSKTGKGGKLYTCVIKPELHT